MKLVSSDNNFIFFTVSCPAFVTGVERVCALSGIGPHPDPKFRIAALAKVLKTSPHPDYPNTEVSIIKQPKDVLELMFIQNLRDLQTNINEALVAVQSVTADPRTDTKLGKVGR